MTLILALLIRSHADHDARYHAFYEDGAVFLFQGEGLRRACREYDVRLTEEELFCMMEEVDIDGDGTVDKEEFLNIMRHAPWF